jgi:ATP-binding cassette subfamily F protein 3
MIRVEKLSKKYGERTLFDKVSFTFPHNEKIALVGPNGTGKSTFLQILTGEIDSSHGEVHVPKSLRIGHLPQEANPQPKDTALEECLSGSTVLFQLRSELEKAKTAMEEDATTEAIERFTELEEKFAAQEGYSFEAKGHAILAGLGFSEQQRQTSPLELSGGWRMRIELAKLFMQPFDFLVLDEPTNHLDLPSLVWVERHLMQFPGTLLFVSHDQEFLNRTATVTMELSGNRVLSYRGNFDNFLVKKEEAQKQEAATLGRIERRKQDLQKFITRFGAKASKAKQAKSKAKMVERLSKMQAALGNSDVSISEMVIPIPEALPSGQKIVEVTKLATGYGDKKLCRDLDLIVENGQRIAIVGANGIGKTTLLKTIHGLIPSLAGTIDFSRDIERCYFAQDLYDQLDPNDSVLEILMRARPELGEPKARSVLGALLFRGDNVFKKFAVLSGGEKSRVGLAIAMSTKSNFLLLDEPTNHLDILSAEVLRQALTAYEGTSLIVSHNRAFLNSLATHTLAIGADGQAILYHGNIEDYLRMVRDTNTQNTMTQSVEKKPPKKEKPKAANRKIDQKKQREIEKKSAKLERAIEKVKTESAEHQASFSEISTTDFTKLGKWQDQKNYLDAKILELEEQWLEVQEQIESSSS